MPKLGMQHDKKRKKSKLILTGESDYQEKKKGVA